MENMDNLRKQISSAITVATKKGKLHYEDAIIEVMVHLYDLLALDKEKASAMILACYIDYYTYLAFKRDTKEMSQQEIHDYERLRRLYTMSEIIDFWNSDMNCFWSAIDICYQLQNGTTSKEELENSLNSYDHIYLKKIAMPIMKNQDAESSAK